jgi:FAD/FMN-containing dehydrogenase
MTTSNSISSAVLDQLRAMVGPSGYLDQPNDIEPFLIDHRKLYHGATPLVLRPNSTEQVSQILALCNTQRIGVVPSGGNTSYCGGATPSADNSQIVLSLSRLKQVRSTDPHNNTLTLESGCVLAEVQQAAEAVDRLFPLSLGSEGSCQIGGNLSTNAGGTAVLRYGMARDLVLGLEVVLPDGRVLDDLNALRKNNMGYDLKNLFMGAEGTLGIITAASLKLFPLPKTRVTAIVAIDDPTAAVALLSFMRSEATDALATFELMPRNALEPVFAHIDGCRNPFSEIHPWYVLIEATTPLTSSSLNDEFTAALARAQEQALIRDGVIAQSSQQREMFWRLRESIPAAERVISTVSVKHDVSVTITDSPRFIDEASALCKQIAPQGHQIIYGHLGDGSLHFNINTSPQIDRETLLAKKADIHHGMHELIARYRGSISAEHGIGKLKASELAHYKNPVAIEVMRSIKQALDPHGIMNPGKVLLV